MKQSPIVCEAYKIATSMAISISEFKKNPMAIVRKNRNSPMVVLSYNRPVFYVVPVEVYERLVMGLDDPAMAAGPEGD